MLTRIPETVDRWTKYIQYWLLPPVCVLCRQPAETRRDLCHVCETGLPRIHQPCRRCALPLPPGHTLQTLCGTCLACPPPYRRMVAPYRYAPPLTTLVSGFKYHGRLVNGRILVSCASADLRHAYRGDTLPELLVPVPLHKQRLRERGYNQSLELARWLSRELGIPYSRHLVYRRKHTPKQTGLSAAARKQNLRGAFKTSGTTPIPKGARVAIVDDVVTTGTTVSALAKVLLRAGVGEVDVWALARTSL